MRARSKIWTKLAARGEFTVQTKAIINGKEYTAISAPKIDRQTMPSALSIGNCCNASLEFGILLEDENDSIPAGAEVVIKSRLFNVSSVSEWLEFGTFYIDKREDAYNGLVNVVAYDAMLKTEQDFIDDDNYNTLGWPITMKAAVEMIAERIGVDIDPRTCIKTGADYVIPLPTGLTVRQVLGYIAACHGGNWIITEENMLRLVPLMQVPNKTYKIISADYEDIVTNSGETLVWKKSTDELVADLTDRNVAKVAITDKARTDYNIVDEAGNHIVTKDGYTLIWGTDGDIYAVNGIINVPVVMGELSTGSSVVISDVVATRTVAVSVNASDEDSDSTEVQNVTTAFSATNGDKSGETLDAGDSPYMTQQICDDLYEEFNGLVYAPYTATKTVYDPATEIGDQIKIGDKVFSVIYNASITLNLAFTSDLSLPAKEESTSEYPYNSELSKVSDQNLKLQSAIERLDNSVRISVKTLSDNLAADELHYDAVLETKIGEDENDKIVSMINASADVISLKAGRLQITSGNFLLDKDGNITVKNGTFQGTVQTGTSSDGSGAALGNGTLKLQYNDTDFLSIYAGAWGASAGQPVTGGIMKCENYLAFLDTSGGFYFAINTGGNPAGWTDDLLFFGTSYFNDDISVKASSTISLGQHTLSFNGSTVTFSSGITAGNLIFEDAPCSGTSAKSLSAILAYLEKKIG